MTADSPAMALRSTFQQEAARGFAGSYKLRVGPVSIYAQIEDETLEVGEGPLPDPDPVIEAGPGIQALTAGNVSPPDALRHGEARGIGDPALLDRFVELFHIGPAPVPES